MGLIVAPKAIFFLLLCTFYKSKTEIAGNWNARSKKRTLSWTFSFNATVLDVRRVRGYGPSTSKMSPLRKFWNNYNQGLEQLQPRIGTTTTKDL